MYVVTLEKRKSTLLVYLCPIQSGTFGNCDRPHHRVFPQCIWQIRKSCGKSQPKKMISDNASTFLSAAEELRSLFRSPSLHDSLSKRGVEWQFIPKRAPWFGGFWERLSLTKKVLGRTYINLAGPQTIITETEAILNDRPITYVSPDIGDPEPLTPSHLLYGRSRDFLTR